MEKFRPTRDAVLIELIDGKWKIHVECLNRENESTLLTQALILHTKGVKAFSLHTKEVTQDD